VRERERERERGRERHHRDVVAETRGSGDAPRGSESAVCIVGEVS